jgi:hypothetical protein
MTAPRPDLLVPVFPFLTPNTPDLGCFVRQKHGFQEDGTFLWAEFAPWTIEDGILPHQCYFRVKCGKAAFFERVKVTMRLDFDPLIYAGIDPDWVLGGDYRPYPSDWYKFPPQRNNMTYWFRGDYRNPSQANWVTDAAVGHTFDIYDNGTLSTVYWDDTGGDRDFNDIILEVAIVFRQAYFGVFEPPARAREEDFQQFVRDQLPKLRPDDRPPDDLTRGT